MSCRLDKRLYTLNVATNIVRLTAIGGTRINAKMSIYPKIQALFSQCTFCDPLLFERNNEIFLSVTFKTPILPVVSEKAIGVDLGINRIAAISDGRIIKSKKFNAQKRRLRYLKRNLQSKNSQSAKRHLKKLRRKEANMNRNFSHHVANEILKTDASLIVIEDLKKLKRNVAFKNAKKGRFGKRQNNKLSQVPFFDLRKILEYKAQALGKGVVTVSPYMTSQEDHRGIKNGDRKGCRYYGSDGKVLDADLNAANNIVLKYPTKLPVTCQSLDGQATVNSPIVGFGSLQASMALA